MRGDACMYSSFYHRLIFTDYTVWFVTLWNSCVICAINLCFRQRQIRGKIKPCPKQDRVNQTLKLKITHERKVLCLRRILTSIVII